MLNTVMSQAEVVQVMRLQHTDHYDRAATGVAVTVTFTADVGTMGPGASIIPGHTQPPHCYRDVWSVWTNRSGEATDWYWRGVRRRECSKREAKGQSRDHHNKMHCA